MPDVQLPALLADAAPPLVGISPPVLFFALGLLAAAFRSNLAIPKAATKLISLYLLWAIGFRGGVELGASGVGVEAIKSIAIGALAALLVPACGYAVLRRLLPGADAAGVAACYGSVSVVTFLAACSALDDAGVPFGGHMVAVMALMESPAIIVSLVLFNLDRARAGDAASPAPRRMRSLLHEAVFNGPVFLLLGSIVVGLLTGERGYNAFKPLCTDAFPGVLAFFLLDLGILAARRARTLLRVPRLVLAFAVVAPACHALLAIAAAHVLGVGQGDAVLLGVLAGSASYIAAPAALRLALPRADVGLAVSLSLGVTFPFNLLVGIPAYTAIVAWWW